MDVKFRARLIHSEVATQWMPFPQSSVLFLPQALEAWRSVNLEILVSRHSRISWLLSPPVYRTVIYKNRVKSRTQYCCSQLQILAVTAIPGSQSISRYTMTNSSGFSGPQYALTHHPVTSSGQTPTAYGA